MFIACGDSSSAREFAHSLERCAPFVKLWAASTVSIAKELRDITCASDSSAMRCWNIEAAPRLEKRRWARSLECGVSRVLPTEGLAQRQP